ncbi:MAG: hypothetical protein ACREUA_10650 [Burkholderiales bacterium]
MKRCLPLCGNNSFHGRQNSRQASVEISFGRGLLDGSSSFKMWRVSAHGNGIAYALVATVSETDFLDSLTGRRLTLMFTPPN